MGSAPVRLVPGPQLHLRRRPIREGGEILTCTKGQSEGQKTNRRAVITDALPYTRIMRKAAATQGFLSHHANTRVHFLAFVWDGFWRSRQDSNLQPSE